MLSSQSKEVEANRSVLQSNGLKFKEVSGRLYVAIEHCSIEGSGYILAKVNLPETAANQDIEAFQNDTVYYVLPDAEIDFVINRDLLTLSSFGAKRRCLVAGDKTTIKTMEVSGGAGSVPNVSQNLKKAGSPPGR